MRRLVGLTHDFSGTPIARTPQPGLADIDALVERLRAAGLTIALVSEGTPGDWGPGAGLAIYRVVQEALTNVLKHAAPGADAEVTLRYEPSHIDITVIDDGAGHTAPVPDADGRHGLAGMRERVAAYDGRLEAGPRPGAGWRVHATLRFR